jgi:signal transduction histidine kinase
VPAFKDQADDAAPPRCIAHDLANLLTILNGSLELANRHSAENPALGRLLANMHVVAERASVLVEELRVSLKPECER